MEKTPKIIKLYPKAITLATIKKDIQLVNIEILRTESFL